MKFGEYLRSLRKEKGMSQRELGELSGFSNTEFSRIESGDRQKPSPLILKAIAPHIGVPYEELLKKAGYLEEVIDHAGYAEHVFTDDDGSLADIVKKAKAMQERDSDWANIAFRVSTELPKEDIEAIKAIANSLLKNNR